MPDDVAKNQRESAGGAQVNLNGGAGNLVNINADAGNLQNASAVQNVNIDSVAQNVNCGCW